MPWVTAPLLLLHAMRWMPVRVFEGMKKDDLSAIECGADIRRMYDSVKTTFYESFLDACGE